MPGAERALARLRDAAIATAVVTNQSAVAHGAISLDDVRAINERVEALLGPLGPVFVCPHAEREGCACRKPQPAMLLDAARMLGIAPEACVMIGDIGSDVVAARNAGAQAILVPTAVTRSAEIDAAPFVARSLDDAIDEVLARAR
jgi:histidinol-phosphate phosphatase family protein